jgi:hypothetical protein
MSGCSVSPKPQATSVKPNSDRDPGETDFYCRTLRGCGRRPPLIPDQRRQPVGGRRMLAFGGPFLLADFVEVARPLCVGCPTQEQTHSLLN